MLSLGLQKAILDYTEKQTTIQQLEAWYLPKLPIFLADPNSSDAEVIADVELLLAEYGDNLLEEAELRQALMNILQQHVNISHAVSITQNGVRDCDYATRLGTSSHSTKQAACT